MPEKGPLGILPIGPLRKKLRGRSHNPVFLPTEIASITGLSEIDTKRFLSTMVWEPFLYVIYDDVGKAVDWDTARDEETIRGKASRRLPEFRSYKIFEAKLTLPMIEEKRR